MEVVFRPVELEVFDRLQQTLELGPQQVIRRGIAMLQRIEKCRQLGFDLVYRSAAGEIVDDPLGENDGCMDDQ